MIVVHIAGIPISESEQRCIRCNCDIRKLLLPQVPPGVYVHYNDNLRSAGLLTHDASDHRKKFERRCFSLRPKKRTEPASV